MKRLICTKILLFSIVLFIFFGVEVPQYAYANEHVPFDPIGQICDESSPDAKNSTICKENAANKPKDGTDPTNPLTENEGLLTRVTNLIAVLTAVAAVIIIVIAGMTMTLSSGDSAKISSSRDAIIYAAVGLVVVAAARAIIIVIINRVG